MPPGKDKEVAHSAEIGRLTALIAKDSRSKLFVPLAEEYMKAGMTDMAVDTLENGIKANPFYMSARVMLGKAYLEKGEAEKAKVEFEQVVKTVPDNLFAYRKLGEIYWAEDRRTEAARAFRMVTILNPKDDEAKRLVELIDSGAMPATEAAVEVVKEEALPHSLPESESEEEQPSHQEMAGPQTFDISETEESAPESESGEPEPSIIEMPVPEMDTIAAPIEAAVGEEAAPEAGAALEEGPVEQPTAVEEPRMVLQGEPEESFEAEEPGWREQPSAAPAYSLDISGNAGFDEILSAYSEPAAADEAAQEEAGGVYEIEEDLSAFDMEGLVVKPPRKAGEEAHAAEDAFETKTLAELYCAQGFYDRAIGIYKNLLSDDPDNADLKSKLEELFWRAGVATAGATPEAKGYPSGANGETIRRLEQFLAAIKRKAGR